MRSFTPPPLPSLQKNNQTNFKKYPTKTNTIQTKTNPNLVSTIFLDHNQTPNEIIKKNMLPSRQNNQSKPKTSRNNTRGTNTNHTQIQNRPQRNKKIKKIKKDDKHERRNNT